MVKTNVLRILDSKKIDYILHEYANDETNGENVARLIGANPNECFKTLVTIANNLNHYVFMVPVNETLDLKKAAKLAGVKNVEMIKQKDLLPLTGYVHGGCSPIGMKKEYQTFADETIILADKIYFSGGKVGINIEMAFDDLCLVINVKIGDIVVR